ncbi:MAG: TrkA family potassium uptake protein [Bacillota bacterium]|nr:TrkA family potassium uptake protein [Bacillota bacterium]
MAKKNHYTQFAVLGLGRFGMSIVQTLSEYDVNVLACDRDDVKLQHAMEYATHVVKADVFDEMALERLGLGSFDVVIMAMGEDFEASQIATMIAKEKGVRRVIVKARNQRQKKILKSIGADEVILPEYEMGKKLARRLVSSDILDILEESDLYTVAEMEPRREWWGKTLRETDIRKKYGITVLATRRGERLTIPVSPDQVIEQDDVLIVFTEKKA